MASQQKFTCSMSTIETLENGLKCIIGVVLVSSLLILNIFHTFFHVFTIDSEKVNICEVSANSVETASKLSFTDTY